MVKIVADSTCDLSRELAEKYEVSIMPLHILLGDKEYEDGRSITPEEIYKWSDENNTTPKTSAPSFETAMEIFQPLLAQYEQVVYLSISEEMSTTANVCRMVAEELDAKDRIWVVNSQNLSTGIGLLVIEAALMANNGMDGVAIVAALGDLIPKVRASFVVDTLVYLHRGGRCGGLSAMLGGAIKLHPRIVVKDGKMSSDKKYRGKMKAVLTAYAKDLEADLLQAKKQRVFITHSGCEQEIIESVREYLVGLNYFDEILETRAGGVISSHCGPGTLGVLFIAN